MLGRRDERPRRAKEAGPARPKAFIDEYTLSCSDRSAAPVRGVMSSVTCGRLDLIADRPG